MTLSSARLRKIFPVEQFIEKLRVEALAVAVLLWASWFDEYGLRTDSYSPLPYRLGDELRAIVRTNMALDLGNERKGLLAGPSLRPGRHRSARVRYRSTRGEDVAIRTRLKELASQRRRFGYRRLHILLKREGVEVNWKKLYPLYREEGLTVRKRGGRKRASGARAPMAVPQGRTLL